MTDTLALNAVHVGDIRELAPRIAPGSVNCIVTSPPYHGLRSYLGGDDPSKALELGSEPTVGEYVANLVAVFRALRPALRDDGTLWVNLGDSYANNPSTSRMARSEQGNGTGVFRVDDTHMAVARQAPNPLTPLKREGIPHKCLTLAPARFAIAMVEDGWICRSEMTGIKVAPMPESVRDRPTSATEKLYMFVKQPRYYYDALAVAEPSVYPDDNRKARSTGAQKRVPTEMVAGIRPGSATYPTRNARNWFYWRPEPFSGSHYATFPSAIPRFAVRAGCPPRVCARCGVPWVRVVERESCGERDDRGRTASLPEQRMGKSPPPERGWERATTTLGWRATCACGAGTVPGVVLDCFSGSGTTPMVAVEEGRSWLGVDLDRRAVGWTAERLAKTQIHLPLDLATEAAGG